MLNGKIIVHLKYIMLLTLYALVNLMQNGCRHVCTMERDNCDHSYVMSVMDRHRCCTPDDYCSVDQYQLLGRTHFWLRRMPCQFLKKIPFLFDFFSTLLKLKDQSRHKVFRWSTRTIWCNSARLLLVYLFCITVRFDDRCTAIMHTVSQRIQNQCAYQTLFYFPQFECRFSQCF